jgi:hypothetical protein
MAFHKLNSAKLSKNGKNKHAFVYLVLKLLYDTSIEKKGSTISNHYSVKFYKRILVFDRVMQMRIHSSVLYLPLHPTIVFLKGF